MNVRPGGEDKQRSATNDAHVARLQAPPLALYVHMPWCVRKCPYCDFNSHAAPTQIPQRTYVDALLSDLDLDRARVSNQSISSIFFGGGTPSLFEPEEIGRLLEGVRARLPVSADVEVTLEANPGTIEHGRFAGYRQAGINRVSLGAQSFNEAHLQALGRIHAVHDIARAVDELTRADIENFNLDLMYGLPEQSIEQAIADLESALALAPTHLSHYQLTLEPGTVFYHRPPILPDDDITWDMQQRCQELLASHGYAQYEVSAYAKPSSRCRHNLNYWSFGDYVGIGAGAHGKITDIARQEIFRTARVRQPREYMSRPSEQRLQDLHVVREEDLAFEFMLNALRLIDGFGERDFEARTGVPFRTIRATIDLAQRRGLLEASSPDRQKPTQLGQRFLNELQALFLPKKRAPSTAGNA
jgi:putative oxygen-independent coproporphyrinogen III oxidase